ncbi:uncharacterized protein LOC132624169 [Lycium barbarum]|uniref:uncharacterized protein LOC132624169 n=1 Tax=Lycium barbarum TaxID=112863 RepID=UPI00293F3E81|nr:uncharacterized protein LOC132624169 [Lycium barbarum]
MYQKLAVQLCQEVEQVTGFTRGMFPLKYLGCPIFHSRKRKVYYNDLIKRVKDRLQNWKGILLSFGGKPVLINSVLQSMPMYLLSAMEPTKYTLNELHKIFEGGLGFRTLFDVSKALFTKQWWRFRNSGTLWSTFMWNKYCKKHIPTRVQWKGGSQLWKKMLVARDTIEEEIWWEPRNGSANFWFDYWTKLGPLAQLTPVNFPMVDSIQDVADVMENGTWNYQTLHKLYQKILLII